MNNLNKLKEVSSFNVGTVTTVGQVNRELNHAKNEENQFKINNGFVSDTEATALLKGTTEKVMDQCNKYRAAFKDRVGLQVELVGNAKVLTQKSKDYSNQMGEALARIDKVMVKDFEAKLLLLERFVIASKEMAELEKSGALQKIATSFVK
jgi:hypothetical protein